MARRVISRVLIPAAVLAEACDLTSCRRTELPIYVPEPEAVPLSNETAVKAEDAENRFVEGLENAIGSVRRSAMSVVDAARSYEQTAVGYVNDGVDQTKWLVQYLGDEENQAPKGPAIAIGGLTGFIFALRGGLFKKIVYTTVGATGMAAVCYPREAAEYGKIFVAEGTQIATIAYNFIYGVKAGDPPLELPKLPKLPGSLSEAWSMATGSTTKESRSVSEQQEELALAVGAENERVSDESSMKFHLNPTGAVGDDEPTEFHLNPNAVVSSLHAEAEKKSCHCPVGGCLNKDGDAQSPSELPYPPSVETCPPCSDPSDS